MNKYLNSFTFENLKENVDYFLHKVSFFNDLKNLASIYNIDIL